MAEQNPNNRRGQCQGGQGRGPGSGRRETCRRETGPCHPEGTPPGLRARRGLRSRQLGGRPPRDPHVQETETCVCW